MIYRTTPTSTSPWLRLVKEKPRHRTAGHPMERMFASRRTALPSTGHPIFTRKTPPSTSSTSLIVNHIMTVAKKHTETLGALY